MRYILKLIILSWVTFTVLFLTGCHKCGEMVIEDFTVIDSLSDSVWLRDNDSAIDKYYLVTGYGGKDCDKQVLENIACDFFKAKEKSCKSMFVYFLKKTRNTNNEKMLENDRDFDRISIDKDFIILYEMYIHPEVRNIKIMNKYRITDDYNFNIYDTLNPQYNVLSLKRSPGSDNSMEIPNGEVVTCFVDLVKNITRKNVKAK